MYRSTQFPRAHKIKNEIVKALRDTGISQLDRRGSAQLKSPSVVRNVENFKIMMQRRCYQSGSGLAKLNAYTCHTQRHIMKTLQLCNEDVRPEAVNTADVAPCVGW